MNNVLPKTFVCEYIHPQVIEITFNDNIFKTLALSDGGKKSFKQRIWQYLAQTDVKEKLIEIFLDEENPIEIESIPILAGLFPPEFVFDYENDVKWAVRKILKENLAKNQFNDTIKTHRKYLKLIGQIGKAQITKLYKLLGDNNYFVNNGELFFLDFGQIANDMNEIYHEGRNIWSSYFFEKMIVQLCNDFRNYGVNGRMLYKIKSDFILDKRFKAYIIKLIKYKKYQSSKYGDKYNLRKIARQINDKLFNGLLIVNYRDVRAFFKENQIPLSEKEYKIYENRQKN